MSLSLTEEALELSLVVETVGESLVGVHSAGKRPVEETSELELVKTRLMAPEVLKLRLRG